MRLEPRIRRTRTDAGPNWVRRESAIEVDILATDPTERPGITSPISERVPNTPQRGRFPQTERLPAPSAEDSLPLIPESADDLARLPAGNVLFQSPQERPKRPSLPPSPVAVLLEPSSGDQDSEERSTHLYDKDDASLHKGELAGSEPQDHPAPARRTAFDPASSNTRGTRLPKPRPSLSVVRSVSDSIEAEYAGLRAAPPAAEPRPQPTGPIDWPPPMERPGVDYPEDWWVDEVGATHIVINPIQRTHLFSSRFGVLLIDGGAWLLGFVTMFITGLVTTGSALLVLVALSIEG